MQALYLKEYLPRNLKKKPYNVIEPTTGHSSEHSATDTERLSRYNIRSHQAGIRFFSLESYPTEQMYENFKQNKSI